MSALLGRLKPGSLTAEGAVVGLYPVRNPMEEPVVVPADYGASLRHTLGRCRALEEAGWVMCPAALQPRILNRDEACLIHRDSAAFRRWNALPPERKRAGAGQ
jgi:hypothetical protein